MRRKSARPEKRAGGDLISKIAGPEPIGPLLEELFSQQGYLTDVKEYGIVAQWPLLVNASMAAASRCEKVENGILYVKMRSAPWRQEAVYMKEKILAKIRSEHGCHTIKDIVFY